MSRHLLLLGSLPEKLLKKVQRSQHVNITTGRAPEKSQLDSRYGLNYSDRNPRSNHTIRPLPSNVRRSSVDVCSSVESYHASPSPSSVSLQSTSPSAFSEGTLAMSDAAVTASYQQASKAQVRETGRVIFHDPAALESPTFRGRSLSNVSLPPLRNLQLSQTHTSPTVQNGPNESVYSASSIDHTPVILPVSSIGQYETTPTSYQEVSHNAYPQQETSYYRSNAVLDPSFQQDLHYVPRAPINPIASAGFGVPMAQSPMKRKDTFNDPRDSRAYLSLSHMHDEGGLYGGQGYTPTSAERVTTPPYKRLAIENLNESHHMGPQMVAYGYTSESLSGHAPWRA